MRADAAFLWFVLVVSLGRACIPTRPTTIFVPPTTAPILTTTSTPTTSTSSTPSTTSTSTTSTSTSSTTTTTTSYVCPTGWTGPYTDSLGEINCFILLTGPGGNGFQNGCQDAITNCGNLGGHLAIIRDAAENAYIMSLSDPGGTFIVTGLQNTMYGNLPFGTCIGLETINGMPSSNKADWQWVDGSAITYDNWGTSTVFSPAGNPDNLLGDCLLCAKVDVPQGEWNSYNCNYAMRNAMCEIAATNVVG